VTCPRRPGTQAPAPTPPRPPPQMPVVGVACPEEIRRAKAPWDKRRFQVARRLGVTRHGELYEGRDAATGAPVAVERIRRLVLPERQAREVERRVAALAQLSHPHVVALYGAFADPATLTVVTELLGPAGDFLDFAAGQGPEGVVPRVVAPLASALALAHSRGLVHRNLHPGALLVRPAGPGEVVLSGWSYVGDFREGRPATAPLHPPGELAVTDAGRFLAPECWWEMSSGSDAVTPRAEVEARYRRPDGPAVDVWALGVLACELMAGAVPFQSASHDWAQACLSPLRLPARLAGRGERDFVLRCCEKRPAERAKAPALLDHPLLRKLVDAHRLRQLEALAGASPAAAAKARTATAGDIPVHGRAAGAPADPARAPAAGPEELPVASALSPGLLRSVIDGGAFSYAPRDHLRRGEGGAAAEGPGSLAGASPPVSAQSSLQRGGGRRSADRPAPPDGGRPQGDPAARLSLAAAVLSKARPGEPGAGGAPPGTLSRAGSGTLSERLSLSRAGSCTSTASARAPASARGGGEDAAADPGRPRPCSDAGSAPPGARPGFHPAAPSPLAREGRAESLRRSEEGPGRPRHSAPLGHLSALTPRPAGDGQEPPRLAGDLVRARTLTRGDGAAGGRPGPGPAPAAGGSSSLRRGAPVAAGAARRLQAGSVSRQAPPPPPQGPLSRDSRRCQAGGDAAGGRLPGRPLPPSPVTAE